MAAETGLHSSATRLSDRRIAEIEELLLGRFVGAGFD